MARSSRYDQLPPVTSLPELTEPPSYFNREVRQAFQMSWRELSTYIDGLHRAGFRCCQRLPCSGTEAGFSADGAGEHAAGDSVRISGRDARSAGRRGTGSGDRNCLLGRWRALLRGHGRRGTVAATPCGMVAGHCFLFSGPVFLSSRCRRKKHRRTRRLDLRNVCAPTTSSDYFRADFGVEGRVCLSG